MGRLFWKFFALVFLAQMAVITAIGVLLWLADGRADVVSSGRAADRIAEVQVDAGAEVLRYAGAVGFRNWSEHEPQPTVLAVDAAGRDVLGRPVSLHVAAEVRQLQRDRSESTGTREVLAADGHLYTLFVAGHGSDRPYGALPPRTPGPAGHNMPPLKGIAATLAASIVTALLLAGYVAKPIRSLRGAFDAAASGDLDRRVAPDIGARHDELADLGRDFDRMAARLKASMQSQRRLLHDVSHELRSPLARMEAAAGLIRQTPDQPETMITRIEEEIARIDRLVGELLTLSRLETGEMPPVKEEVDMHDLVRDVVHDANFEAQSQEREVIWDDQGSATLQGRPELLHSAIENVVRNALKHAPQSQTIRVETAVNAEKGQYVLRVLDHGHGIPEGELPDLFRPFFRGTTGIRMDGYGLGLAIAHRSIEAHGGTIRATNRSGGGLSVEIVVPLSCTTPLRRHH
ncbi:MAG TPA: ATP-binding protein [Steroidobacteraceae bacterium]|nr:ATP-binding protein [Steroidobacteraceae bacterium]